LKLRPMFDVIVVARDQAEEKSAGGIWLPTSAQRRPQKATVLAVGEGARDKKTGKQEPLQDVAVGDVIYYDANSGDDFRVGDRELSFIRRKDVEAVIDG